MEERVRREKELNETQIAMMQSQLNPHFLYNTLDTIVWMAEFNDSRRVVNITKSLAQYFRLALNQGQEQILLRDEIDHVRQYLFIQKQRYGEKLNYEILEDERLGDYQLPKLVLQPLVENAIYHGLKNVDQRLRLQFGEGYHMEIDSKANSYTKITLYLPLSSGDESS